MMVMAMKVMMMVGMVTKKRYRVEVMMTELIMIENMMKNPII